MNYVAVSRATTDDQPRSAMLPCFCMHCSWSILFVSLHSSPWSTGVSECFLFRRFWPFVFCPQATRVPTLPTDCWFTLAEDDFLRYHDLDMAPGLH